MSATVIAPKKLYVAAIIWLNIEKMLKFGEGVFF